MTILCDRFTTNVGKSQVGFGDFVVYPYFEALTKILPKMQYTLDQLKENKVTWQASIEQYEKEMVEGNKAI